MDSQIIDDDERKELIVKAEENLEFMNNLLHKYKQLYDEDDVLKKLFNKGIQDIILDIDTLSNKEIVYKNDLFSFFQENNL